MHDKWSTSFVDLDDDNRNEEVKTAWTYMNHGPHELRVIKNNNVLIKAEGANIGAVLSSDGKGLLLYEVTDWNEGLYKITFLEYENQKLVPLWYKEICKDASKPESILDQVKLAVETEDIDTIISLQETIPFDCKQGLDTDYQDDSPLKNMVQTVCGNDRQSTVNTYGAGFLESEGVLLLKDDYRNALTKIFKNNDFIYYNESFVQDSDPIFKRIMFINNTKDFLIQVEHNFKNITAILLSPDNLNPDELNRYFN